MRVILLAACLLLAAAPTVAADAADAQDASQCLGVRPGGFTGTCWTSECGYIYVLGSEVGQYGPCVTG